MDVTTHAGGEHVMGREAPPADSAREWFDVGDLAQRYKTSARHIYRMADCGRMPWGIKLGQLRRWSRREIEVWEAGGCKAVRSARGAVR